MKSPPLPSLVFSLLIINVFGLTTILSIFPDLFANQVTFVLAGLFLLLIFSRLDARLLQSLSFHLYILSILLLFSTFLLGGATRGSIRWIDIGPFRFQSSEFIKPLLVVFFADRFLQPIHNPLRWLFVNTLFLAIPAGLVFLQPDLGSTIVIFALWFGMLLSSPFPKKLLLTLSALGAALSPISYQLLADYQKKRIETFLNPFSDPKGAGYNVIQAMIAVGSGSLLGKGVRQGTQSHLRFLPERHTDFAFASFAEEFGFVGSSLLILSFATLLYWLASLSQRLSDFSRLITIGVFWLFFTQISINIGMNMGVLPVTGITLPFISYGGSSLLTSCIAIGLVLAVRKNRKEIDL